MITRGKHKLTLHRQGGSSDNWISDDEKPQEIPGEKIDLLVKTLLQTQILSFQPATPDHLQEAGLEPPFGPAATIDFIAHLSENTADDDAGDHTVAKITFGTRSGLTLFAHLNDSPDLVQISAQILEALKLE